MASSLKEYLKKYTGEDNDDKKKKKKKTKRPVNSIATGVLVVDKDPVWQKPVNIDEEEDNSADEEKPLVDEDIEVKRMKRLDMLKSRRQFGAISEDGSGWVPVSNEPENVKPQSRNSDISPPRRRVRNDTPSPKSIHRPDADLSPPRKRRARNDTPSPKASDHPDTDLSPPRKRRVRNDTPSPKASDQHDADLSPPRKRGGRQKARYDTPSPNGETSESDRIATDLSPPRRHRREKHESPEPKRKSRFADSDISPPRRSSRKSDNGASISDLSPPRRKKGSPAVVDRPKTGLVSGKDVKQEIDKTKKDDLERFRKMDPSVSGRDAEAIYRNKITGERMSREEFVKSKEKKKEEKPKEIKLEWGKGLAQKREAEARLQELEVEKDMPFARTRDDANLDKMLKERVRWGDPMAHLVQKNYMDPVLPDLGDSEKMKESGFIVPQEIPSHSWLRRGLDAAPNRYGIKPGRHWDGVDRSTGYEKGLFKRTNEKKATEQEAYQWSVADM